MIVIPAVDIKDGQAVRLEQGRAERETVYDKDPLNAAQRWAELKPKRIHIVDLDGAFDGVPKNRAFVLGILQALKAQGIESEIGGGLRTEAIVAEYIAGGATRCVIG